MAVDIEPRTRPVQVRLSQSEYEAIEKCAVKDRSMSAYLRRLGVEDAALQLAERSQ